MSSQRFCLRWNNHQSNLLSVFDQLLHDESFVDVTLAVEGQLLRAHKMVLSACSPYFQALFVNHPDKHPIVILKDVPYSDMRSLLDFMYRGEVSVDQDRLTAFLRVAESLRIKGLTEVNEEKCDIPSITSSLLQPQQSNPPPHLHRIGQQPHKRQISHMMNPLLGNALMQPKRKRGRPRKLSGSSNGTPGGMGSPSEDFDNRTSGDMLVQGSPEMLEVKMGMDGFAAGGNTSDSSTGKNENAQEEVDSKVKDEEPVAGSSKQEQDAAAPVKSQEEFSAGYETDQDDNSLSIRVISDSSQQEVIGGCTVIQLSRPVPVIKRACSPPLLELQPPPTPVLDEAHGVHFLTPGEQTTNDETAEDNQLPRKTELLEYLIRGDGSVTCKLCGEILASRTHWYRHKYKLHGSNQVTTTTVVTGGAGSSNSTASNTVHPQPTPLYKCELCSVFFKSKKGYMGHVAARHTLSGSEEGSESQSASPQEANQSACTETSGEKGRKREGSSGSNTGAARGDLWERQREKEEKLVADIIDRVRRECEAQGAMVSRRGYTRRSTVMNSCN